MDDNQKRILAELALAFATPGGSGDSRNELTVGELWDAYQPVSRARHRDWATTISRSMGLLRILGTDKVMSLTASRVLAFRNVRGAEKSKKKGREGELVAPATVNREVALLKRMCSWGSDEAIGLLPHNPVARLKQEREDNAREFVYSDAQIEDMVTACRVALGPRLGPVLACLVLVLRDTGMRIGEVLSLELDQIDTHAHTIYIHARSTKTRHARATRISERALDAIDATNWRGKRYLMENPKTRRPFSYDYMSMRFCEVVDHLHIRGPNGERPTRHDLRRTFATMARRRGIPEGVVMKLTGHRSRNVFDRYGIVGPEDVQSANRVLDAHERRNEKPKDKYPLKGGK